MNSWPQFSQMRSISLLGNYCQSWQRLGSNGIYVNLQASINSESGNYRYFRGNIYNWCQAQMWRLMLTIFSLFLSISLFTSADASCFGGNNHVRHKGENEKMNHKDRVRVSEIEENEEEMYRQVVYHRDVSTDVLMKGLTPLASEQLSSVDR